MRKKNLALLILGITISTTVIGCGKEENRNLTYRTLNLSVAEETNKNSKEDILFKKVTKDYLYMGEISLYKINSTDKFKATLIDTGKSARIIKVDFEGVLEPKEGEFVPLGIDKEGNIFLVGEMTDEEPHLANNKK